MVTSLEQYPIERATVIESCPGEHASPSQVRDWIRTYLSYRGLDPYASRKFLWRGIELYRTKIPELRGAFGGNCNLQDWEADIIAHDVYDILEKALPQSEHTFFQAYISYLLGSDYYRKLMFNTRESTAMGHVIGVATWAKFLVGHLLVVTMAWSIIWMIKHR